MTNRQKLLQWEQVAKNIRRLKVVKHETPAAKEKRIAELKKDFVKCSQYYFPEYASAEFAPFHLKIAKAMIDNDECYGVAALAREHGKSVLIGLLVPFYLMITGRSYNMLLVSHNKDNATELLMPLVVNLENNQRIINDFGIQKGFRNWEMGNWRTKNGFGMRAIGAGQSPRGTRNEEKRPDLVVIDDIDTDEECRNQTRIDNKWKWIEQALFPTMSISGSKRFWFAGNIIAKESCIVKAMRVADFKLKVNILDKHGKPSWPRYSLKQVEYMLSKISYASGQKEYFNNPINEGTVFKEITYGKIPPLSKFKMLISYCDPSYKNTKRNDFKAVVLLGLLNGTLYVIKAFVDQTSVAKMIAAFYDQHEFVDNKVTLYKYIEAGSLQETFYDEIFRPRLADTAKARGYQLSISADNRKKTDKFTRIEASLEPLNRQGRMIFNEKERENPHMRRLEEQFKAIEPSLPAHDDGPDAVEGGYWILNTKLRTMTVTAGQTKKRSTKKY